MEAQLDLIDGVRCAPSQTLDIELTNPSTGGLIARVAQTDPTEVDRAIAALEKNGAKPQTCGCFAAGGR